MRPSRLLSNARLPKLPIALPTTAAYAVEAAGIPKPPTHEQLSKQRAELLQQSIPVTKDAFWSMPIHEGLEFIARRYPYHTVAGIAMEQSMFSLFDEMLMCHDAPLPHVMYTDFLQCKTFSSHQLPPDEQFSLPAPLLRTLLQMASFHLLHDPHYFTSIEKLFRTIELQQTVGSEVLSAWVQCCVFAGKTALAVHTLKRMDENKVNFDAEVFCNMMAPTSVGPSPAVKASDPSVKLAHSRLYDQMSSSGTASSVGLHATFVANSLLMRHAAKWEVLRLALSDPSLDVASRTTGLAAEVLDLERGMRCGPKTNEALAVAFAERGATEALYKTLYYMRHVEQLPQYASEPMAEFSEVSVERIKVAVRKTVSLQRDKRLQGSLSIHLLTHTAEELRRGLRPGGPLSASLTNASEKAQYEAVLALAGAGGGVERIAIAAQSGGEPPQSDSDNGTLVSDAPPAPRPAGGHTSRLADEATKKDATAAWAMARMSSAWMNPSKVAW